MHVKDIIPNIIGNTVYNNVSIPVDVINGGIVALYIVGISVIVGDLVGNNVGVSLGNCVGVTVDSVGLPVYCVGDSDI